MGYDAMTGDNVLLSDRELPAFGRIRAEQVGPAVDAVLAEHKAAIRAIGEAETPRDFEHVVLAKERVDFALERMWSPVSHLHSVADTPELRAAFGEAQPKLAEHGLEVGQDRNFYEAVRAVAEQADFAALPPAARRVVEHALRDFRLS